MKTYIKEKASVSKNDNIILIIDKISSLKLLRLSKEEINYIKKEKEKKKIILLNQYYRKIAIIFFKKEQKTASLLEKMRMIGCNLLEHFKNKESVLIINPNERFNETLAICEGMALTNYMFNNHKTTKSYNVLKTIYLKNVSNKKHIKELQNLIDSVYITRDLINEPFSHLTAIDLANKAKVLSKTIGIKTTVLNKKKIKDLKMGGLLAVNKGSLDDPTFTIMEWSPKKSKNKKPIVLVGKGIVYDTGGLSLKPTKNSMDLMKIDMAGGATVIGAMYAIAKNKLNVHVIGLIPATDNRPSGNAYAPGDVITMHNQKTVEVLNTDAEGRLILADALSYAQKYNPELVIDLATLTGSAVQTIGHYGMIAMHKNSEKDYADLKNSGDLVHERLAELPFWEDYDNLLNSEVADIKNIGGPNAGSITAGKFLSNFINYNWIHIDLSCVWAQTKFGYRGKGATGMGVRLLYHFIKHRYI